MILRFRTNAQLRPWARNSIHARSYATAVGQDVRERRSAEHLPDTPARTRFAPSPTGYLHLGSLRTAIFNYLLAKATDGQFILRIEDTDQKRTLPDAVSRLCEDLQWAGLQWDEGPEVGGPYEPYIQSERVKLYQKHVEDLLRGGHAYRCFCSAERLHKLAEQKHSSSTFGSYDRQCLRLSEDEVQEKLALGMRSIVRLKMPQSVPAFRDLTYGLVKDGAAQEKKRKLSSEGASYEDPVLMKSDGYPTYHLANVVDDHLMKITHVIRAAEWLPSTPKHLVLYKAFGWEAPTFAHVGLILDASKQKMSKRVGGNDIRSFREQGFLPEALINHLTLLGWSHRLTTDFLQPRDLIENFDLKFTKGNVVEYPGKLHSLQGRHAAIRLQEEGQFFHDTCNRVQKLILDGGSSSDRLCTPVQMADIIQKLLYDYASHFESTRHFADRHLDLFYNRARQNHSSDIREKALLGKLPKMKSELELINDESWTSAKLKATLDKWQRQLEPQSPDERSHVLGKAMMKYLRWALYGGRPGPPIHDVMLYLGRQETCRRLTSAESKLD